MSKEITYAEALQVAATLFSGRAEIHPNSAIKINGVGAAALIARLADDILFYVGTHELAERLERKNV